MAIGYKKRAWKKLTVVLLPMPKILRMGKLYKDHGRWNGEQLLDSAFIAKSIQPRFEESPEYGYGWWLTHYQGEKGLP